jgi:hypothetical protein
MLLEWLAFAFNPAAIAAYAVETLLGPMEIESPA